jgi:hypothetical protein
LEQAALSGILFLGGLVLEASQVSHRPTK